MERRGREGVRGGESGGVRRGEIGRGEGVKVERREERRGTDT